jgi:sulfite reductase beta subunit-like hemoprotein
VTLTSPATSRDHLAAAQLADIEKFEVQLARLRSGDLDPEAFRVFRLNNGIYGQRQGGEKQMLRVKVPYGAVTADQLEACAEIAERYSRGWGHITTRQNIQFHHVELDDVPAVLRILARAGMTTREACGDTVRNVQACHLAGACPYEVLDVTPWAEAVYQYFVRNPIAQRMPRKFKFNFSGCDTDCGQAMFNDVGIIAVRRTGADGAPEVGFRVFVAGGLGANPHPALALEEFTSREDLLATCEAILRVQDHHGNRDNKLRARTKWLVDTMGIDELRGRIFTERLKLVASATWPGGVPAIVREHGDAPAGRSETTAATPVGHGVPVTLRRRGSYDRWEDANVVRGVAKETVSAYAYARLGDVTVEQFRALAAIQRRFDADVRVTNRQNLVFRNLVEEQLPDLFADLEAIGMAEPGAELVRDVVACPGADTCNLAVTQSRGLADEIGRQLEEAGLGDTPGLRINISGCTNSCGQHHISDIGFHGAERRAHGKAAPGYQMLLGGHVGDAAIEFGQRATRLPAKAAAEAAVRVVRRFVDERVAGEAFRSWLERSGGPAGVGATLKDLDVFPTPEERPDFYVDYDETGPYVVEIGQSECAT